MRAAFTLWLFALGASLGSFLALLVDRRGRDLWTPSHCNHCKRPLAPWELIPLVSFLLRRGRCTCQEAISPSFFLMELISALALPILYFSRRDPLYSLAEISLFLVLFTLSYWDIREREIPTTGLWILGIFSFTLYVLRSGKGVDLLPLFLFVALIRPLERWVGEGDLWVLGILGLTLSLSEYLYFFWFLQILGGIVGVFLLWRGRRGEIPYLPMITLSYFLFLHGGIL